MNATQPKLSYPFVGSLIRAMLFAQRSTHKIKHND